MRRVLLFTRPLATTVLIAPSDIHVFAGAVVRGFSSHSVLVVSIAFRSDRNTLKRKSLLFLGAAASTSDGYYQCIGRWAGMRDRSQ
ncbi:hypothetical protein EI94DRAFT_1722579 [Lactarius quietus]|nr:hypothetical protein EI94DRAFT_1722579 [Lactarius quietus]